MACNGGGAGEDIPEGPGLVSPTAAEHLTMQHGQVNSQNHSGACIKVQLDPSDKIDTFTHFSWMQPWGATAFVAVGNHESALRWCRKSTRLSPAPDPTMTQLHQILALSIFSLEFLKI